jgi:DNA repair photolyase
MMEDEKYKNPILHTSQFVMCGNCFRADTYRGCDFGCKYCFANNRQGNFETKDQVADIQLIKKWFHDAIIKGDTGNIKKEMLNHRVPLHLGGMADPFQTREWKYGATKELLKISSQYQYPINISTKTASLPEPYFEILNPQIHTFQISLIGITDEYVRRFETETPTPAERINFVKQLKDRGFWVSIRIQPLIKISEALRLIGETDRFVDYYTVEHLKLPSDNTYMMRNLLPLLHDVPEKLIPKGREWEFGGATKESNIARIKNSTKVRIGCGDNDFHTLSDSLNCCGIDTMPEAFGNWMKYNSMYIKMTGDRSQWFPKNDCTGCFNSTCVVTGMKSVKDYTERYYRKLYGDDHQSSLFA